MNPNNVVPFEHPLSSGLARRGSPDKALPVVPDTIELECPRCAAVLCLESDLLFLGGEVLCAGCQCTIPVGPPPERVDIQR